MAIREFTIREFGGVDQSRDESRISPGDTADACNMDTTDGSLAVAKGYVRHLFAAVPGTGAIKRLYVWRSLVTVRYIAIAGLSVYAYVEPDPAPAWKQIHAYTGIVGNRWDFIETKIGGTDFLIIANGEGQLIKWDGISPAAQPFGSAEKASNIAVNFLAMHYSRLFAAGDFSNTSRLYWSALPGTSGTVVRTIEDWSRDDASPNTSGGYVEVGDTGGDPIVGLCPLSNQLLIFKRGSLYRLLGDRPSNYRVLRVDAEVEEMVDTSVIYYGDTPFWMTKAGMYYFDGQTARRMYNARNIKDTLKSVYLARCKGAENRDRLYFSMREGQGAGNDDAMIVYDVQRKTYMLRRGFDIADLFALNGVLYMINSSRYVCRMEEGSTYDGRPIEAYWKTPLTDLDSKAEIKSVQLLLLRGEGDPLIVDVQVGRNTANYRYLMPEDPSDILEIPLKNEGRMFRVRFSNEASGSFVIRGGVTFMIEPRKRTI